MPLDRAVESQIRLFTDTFTHVEDLPLASINTKQSRLSQNRRTEKLDDEHAFRIAEAMDLGVEPPPIIVNKVGANEYRVVDGNHRVEGYRLNDRETIRAYVLEVDGDTYRQMCLSANAYNGKPLTDADRMANALVQVNNGLPATTASKVWGIRPDRLQVARREQEGIQKLSDAGVRSNVSPKVAVAMNRLEVDQIRRLAPELRDVTAVDAENAVRAILAAPAAERDTEAIRQAGVLADRRATRQAPKTKAKAAATTASVRRLLRDALVAVQTNHAHLNDTAVRDLVAELAREVEKHEVRTAA